MEGEPGINVDRYLSGVKANVLRGLNVRISVVKKYSETSFGMFVQLLLGFLGLSLGKAVDSRMSHNLDREAFSSIMSS
jgi:hypothetical protein